MGERGWMRLCVGAAVVLLVVAVALPLTQVVARSFQDRTGSFAGLGNYQAYLRSPALASSLGHSLFVAGLSSGMAVVLSFGLAYALTRSAMPGKKGFRAVAMLPLFAPSLVPAIALVYLFGNKGLVTTGFFGAFPGWDIGLYGPVGIVLGEVFHCLPHATLILTASLELADARLYEAAAVLRASPFRTFWTVTLPSAKYGLISAAFVCFTLVLTDFGVPKVVGGTYGVLATDIYKQVIGQQNFGMGAAVSVLLLVPAVLAFVIDRVARRRQSASIGAGAVAWVPRRRPLVDAGLLALCTGIGAAVLLVYGTAVYASLVQVWPYDLRLGLEHYDFEATGFGGLGAFWNSLRMSVYSALLGTAACFSCAYLAEKGRDLRPARGLLYVLSVLPVAMPGLVLGLAYIFFFGSPDNPLHGIYGTMAILVLSNVAHFFTVGFLTFTAALQALDPEIEAVSASLKVPFYRCVARVTLPLCLPAICEVGLYLFVSSMVTVSAVVFLASADVPLASVAVLIMDDNGDTAPAAAMCTLIVGGSLGMRLLYGLATRRIRRRAAAWTRR